MLISKSKATLVLFVLLLICWNPIYAQGLHELVDNPDAAELFDYCTWKFEQGADTSGISHAQAIYENTDGTTVSERTSAMLMLAGVDIAKASRDIKGCKKDFEKGEKEYEKVFSKSHRKLEKDQKLRLSSDASIAEVQRRISALWVEDQARRQV